MLGAQASPPASFRQRPSNGKEGRRGRLRSQHKRFHSFNVATKRYRGFHSMLEPDEMNCSPEPLTPKAWTAHF